MILQKLISEEEYAKLRGFSIRSAQYERAARKGPPFIKLGGKVFYNPDAIDRWVLAQQSDQIRAKKSA